MPRFSHVITSRRSFSARSTSAAVSPSVRARTASRAPRGSCAWIASSRSGDGVRVARRRPREQLRREPLADRAHSPQAFARTTSARRAVPAPLR